MTINNHSSTSNGTKETGQSVAQLTLLTATTKVTVRSSSVFYKSGELENLGIPSMIKLWDGISN
jgi:hypothetical protein